MKAWRARTWKKQLCYSNSSSLPSVNLLATITALPLCDNPPPQTLIITPLQAFASREPRLEST